MRSFGTMWGCAVVTVTTKTNRKTTTTREKKGKKCKLSKISLCAAGFGFPLCGSQNRMRRSIWSLYSEGAAWKEGNQSIQTLMMIWSLFNLNSMSENNWAEEGHEVPAASLKLEATNLCFLDSSPHGSSPCNPTPYYRRWIFMDWCFYSTWNLMSGLGHWTKTEMCSVENRFSDTFIKKMDKSLIFNPTNANNPTNVNKDVNVSPYKLLTKLT